MDKTREEIENEKKDSSIVEYYDTWTQYYEEIAPKYFKDKLFGNLPNHCFQNKQGDFLEKIKSTQYISNFNLLTFYRKLIISTSQEGYKVVVVEFMRNELTGKYRLDFTISNLVLDDNYKGQETYIRAIANVKRGTIPLIQNWEFGLMEDKIWYTKDDSFDYSKDDEKVIKDLLDSKKTIRHNLGILRAVVFINKEIENSSKSSENTNRGSEDLTERVRQLIDQADLIQSRIASLIEFETNYAVITSNTGKSITISPKGQSNVITDQSDRGAYTHNARQQKIGGVKFEEFNASGQDDQNVNIIDSKLTLKELREERGAMLSKINDMLGISITYEADGKTNDVEAKVDKTGDSAYTILNSRKNLWEAQLNKLWLSAIAIMKSNINSSEINEIEDLEVFISVEDFRKTMAFIKADSSILKALPLYKKLMMTFGINKQEADSAVEEREKEVKEYLSAFLDANNNNLPDGLKYLKDLDFVDEEIIKQVVAPKPTNESGGESNSGDKGNG